MRKLIEVLRRIPLTPILLFLLVLVMFLNWRATVALHETVKRNDSWETQVGLQIQEINAQMDDVKALKAIKDNTDCLRVLHPIWCR